MSALLYRKANGLHDDEIGAWAKKNHFLLHLPMVKFGLGCICYLLGVICLTYRDLGAHAGLRYASLGIGAVSISASCMTAIYLSSTGVIDYFNHGLDALEKLQSDIEEGGAAVGEDAKSQKYQV
jgi:hypothetical protein